MSGRWDVQRIATEVRVERLGQEDGLERVLYTGEPLGGAPSRVFAYVGCPAEAGGPVPGIVCVHGGGGAAFPEWVRRWNERGYAAIAMDLAGCGPGRERLPDGGPGQGMAEKFDLDRGWENMWTYHAVAAVIRACTVLRSWPGVDPGRVGLTGISWGGYLTCIVAGLDDRFAFAAPVYGCGYLQDGSANDWMQRFYEMVPAERRQWHEWCDPASYLPAARMPMLFLNGTNDAAYPLGIYRQSYRLAPNLAGLCVRLRMAHSHPDGWKPEEVGLFADHLLRGGPALPRLGPMAVAGRWAESRVTAGRALRRAALLWTADDGVWPTREWREAPATVRGGVVRARVPAGARACFLGVEDEAGAWASAPHEELQPAAGGTLQAVPPGAARLYPGRWYGPRAYLGLHYDLHANEKDLDLGTRCSEKELVPMLRLMGPDFVQTDCKGHAGYTSWFSKVPDSSVAPHLRKDAMVRWRSATKRLGLPLHAHYSGIWDNAAGAKHPEWCVMPAPGAAPAGEAGGGLKGAKMCPRSPYVRDLLIPQLKELVDRYGLDGFWIDGDLWAVEPCYCPRCRAAFEQETGIGQPPVATDDPAWPAWWDFMRRSFEAYVTRYCDALHLYRRGIKICSNWLQTFRHPGAPSVPTDWISGDNHWVWGIDGSRCEARFLSTRGKPWDIMLWAFYCSHGMGKPDSAWTFKPPEMLMQEAAVLLAFGGQVQIYEHPGEVRDGRLVPWRQRRLREVARFVHRRRALCQGTETVPQVAVLHSEHHLRSTVKGANLMWGTDASPVQGAVFALLENSLGVDILDEWALLPRLREFPVVVAPEQHAMSAAMAAALKAYVKAGGRLLVTGAESFDTFGGAFLGAAAGELEEKRVYHVPAADGSVPLYSERWRLLRPRAGTAALGRLGRSPLLDDRLLPNPAATLRRVGAGAVAFVPAALFRDFCRNRYPLTRAFAGEVLRSLAGRFDVEVRAPACIDVTLRRRGGDLIVHLINTASGISNRPNNGAVDEIPRVGPIEVALRAGARAGRASLELEAGRVSVRRARGRTVFTVPSVRVHAALVVKGALDGAGA